MQDKVALHLSPRLGAPSSLGRPCLHVLTCGQGSATPSASVLCPRMAGLTSSACSTPCWLPLRGHKGPSWVLRLWGRWGTACARVSGSHPCPGSWQSPLVLAGVGFSRPGAPLKWGDRSQCPEHLFTVSALAGRSSESQTSNSLCLLTFQFWFRDSIANQLPGLGLRQSLLYQFRNVPSGEQWRK